jgi:hypothetical protein
MNKSDTPEKRESFRLGMRWPKGQRILFFRHCEERHYRELTGSKGQSELSRNKRRGNLLSLTKAREPFSIISKNSSLQTQCDEIASGMRQQSFKFVLRTYSTTPRNDEEWWELRLMQSFQIKRRIEIIL